MLNFVQRPNNLQFLKHLPFTGKRTKVLRGYRLNPEHTRRSGELISDLPRNSVMMMIGVTNIHRAPIIGKALGLIISFNPSDSLRK